jgi:hypothetical protein
VTIRQQSQALAGQTVDTTRQVLAKGADVVAALPTQVREMLAKGRAISDRASEGVARVAEYPLGTFEVVATLSARRLKAAAEAKDYATLVAGQKAINPDSVAAAQAEAKKYLELCFEAKDAFDAKLKQKVMGLVSAKPRSRKARAVQAVPANEAA